MNGRVSDVELARRSSRFTLHGPLTSLECSLRVTGAHNVANAAVVAVLARHRGIDDNAIVAGLSNFLGAPRRYQYRGAWRGVDVYEDYAHLPGEIEATLTATRAAGYERVVVVFSNRIAFHARWPWRTRLDKRSRWLITSLSPTSTPRAKKTSRTCRENSFLTLCAATAARRRCSTEVISPRSPEALVPLV